MLQQTTSQGEGDIAGVIDAEEDEAMLPAEGEPDECNVAVPEDVETEPIERWNGSPNWRPEGEGVGVLTDILEEGHTPLDQHSRDEHHPSPVSFPWQPSSTHAHRSEELHSGRFAIRASHEVDDVGRLNANIEEYESVVRSGSMAHTEPTHNAPERNNAELAHSTQLGTCVFESQNVASQNHVSERVVIMNHLGPEMRSDSSTEEYYQAAITNGYHSNHKDGGEVDGVDTRVSFTDLRSRFETEKSCDRVVKRRFSATKVNHSHSTESTSSLKFQNNNESGREDDECTEPVADSVNVSKSRYVAKISVNNSDTCEGEPATSVVGQESECLVEDTRHVTLRSAPATNSHIAEGEWGATELRQGVDSHTHDTGVSVDSCTYDTGVSVDSHTDNIGMSVDSRTNDISVSLDSYTYDTGVSEDSRTDVKVSTAKVVLSVSSVSQDDDTDDRLPGESVSTAMADDRSEEIRERVGPSELSHLEGEGVYKEEGSVEEDELQEGNVLIMGQDSKSDFVFVCEVLPRFFFLLNFFLTNSFVSLDMW